MGRRWLGAIGLVFAACAPAPATPADVAARALSDQVVDEHWAFDHRGGHLPWQPPAESEPETAEQETTSHKTLEPEDAAILRVCHRPGTEPATFLLTRAAAPFLPLLDPMVAKFAAENPDAVLVVRRGPRPKGLVRDAVVLRALGVTAVELPPEPDPPPPGVHFEAVRLPAGAAKGRVVVRTCPEGGCGPADLPIVSPEPPTAPRKSWLMCRGRLLMHAPAGRWLFLRGEADRVALVPRASGPLSSPRILFATRLSPDDLEVDVKPIKPIGPREISIDARKGCTPRPAASLETIPLGPSVSEVRVTGHPSTCDPPG